MQDKNCDFFKEQLYDYASDLLSDAESRELLSHIQSCRSCAKELDDIRAIIAATSALPELEVPAELRSAVSEKLSAIGTKQNTNKRIVFRRIASFALPAAACVALTIGAISGGILDNFINSDKVITSEVDTGQGKNAASETDNNQTKTIDNAIDSDSAASQTEIVADNQSQPNSTSNKDNSTLTGKTPQVSDRNSTNRNVNSSVDGERQSTLTNGASESSSPVESANSSSDIQDASAAQAAPSEAPTSVSNEESAPNVASNDIDASSNQANDSTTSRLMSVNVEEPNNTYDVKSEDSPQLASQGNASAEIADASGGSSENTVEESASDIPTSCTVTADDLSVFSFKYGVTAKNNELQFEISDDEWPEFLNFSSSVGAKVTTDYTNKQGSSISITIRKS